MRSAMNKHGHTGVRKRTDGRAKPYYARLRFNGGAIYTKSHETPEAAGKEYERYATARAALSSAAMIEPQ